MTLAAAGAVATATSDPRWWSCLRKVRYDHRSQSERARVKFERGLSVQAQSYHCGYCRGWHVGKVPMRHEASA